MSIYVWGSSTELCKLNGGMRKMKEKYLTPEIEVIEFETEDIITASNPGILLPDIEI